MALSLLQADMGLGTSAGIKGLIPRYWRRAAYWDSLEEELDPGTADDVTITNWREFLGKPLLVPRLSLPEDTGPSEIVGISSYFDATADESDKLDALVMSAELGNEALFVRAATQIDWAQRPAADLLRGVRLALSAGAHLLARQLAAQGARYYPNDPELLKAARILAPPRVVRTDLPPEPYLQANRSWLRANRQRYRGQWVALREGQLLASATTVRELRAQIGSLNSILVTKV